MHLQGVPTKLISEFEEEMDNQTTTMPTPTSFPTEPRTNPGNQSYGWVAWMGLCVLTVVLVSMVFYRLMIEMKRLMVNIYKFILHSLSLLNSFFSFKLIK
jgi:hypothetical protein